MIADIHTKDKDATSDQKAIGAFEGLSEPHSELPEAPQKQLPVNNGEKSMNSVVKTGG